MNARELRNAIERAALLATGPMLQLADFPPQLQDQPFGPKPATDEKAILLDTLRDHQFNREATAKALNISRSTLWRKMKRHNLGK